MVQGRLALRDGDAHPDAHFRAGRQRQRPDLHAHQRVAEHLSDAGGTLRPAATGGPRGVVTECADVPDETYGDGQIANEAVRRLEAAVGQDRHDQPAPVEDPPGQAIEGQQAEELITVDDAAGRYERRRQ